MKVIENSKIYCLAADLRLQVSGETLNPISTLPYFVKVCSRTPWTWWKHQNFLHQALDQASEVNWKHESGILAPEWVWSKKKDFNLWNTWEYEGKITFGDCSRWFLFNKMRDFPSVHLETTWQGLCSCLIGCIKAADCCIHRCPCSLQELSWCLWNCAWHFLFLRKAPFHPCQLPACPWWEGWRIWAHPALQAGDPRIRNL